MDVQPKLAARVRLLNTGQVNKNDPNDARSVAVAALRTYAQDRFVALVPGIANISLRARGPCTHHARGEQERSRH